MKIPAFLTQNPKVLLKKLVRFSVYLGLLMLVLVYFKYEKDRKEKEQREIEGRHKALAETDKLTKEVNWEEEVKTILPEQEELLNPNVLPQLMIPPLLGKIQVPDALVYERKKRYTAAYEFHKTPPITFWSVAATAAQLDVSSPVSVDMPAIAPPLSKEPTPSRKPKPVKGVGQTYILLP